MHLKKDVFRGPLGGLFHFAFTAREDICCQCCLLSWGAVWQLGCFSVRISNMTARILEHSLSPLGITVFKFSYIRYTIVDESIVCLIGDYWGSCEEKNSPTWERVRQFSCMAAIICHESWILYLGNTSLTEEMHLIDLQVKQKGLMETCIPWQAKGSLQILDFCEVLYGLSGLGKMWFMKTLCQQETAASLNHLLGWQPQSLKGGEVAEVWRKKGVSSILLQGCKMIASSDIKEGTGCTSCSAEWGPEHSLASLSCSPLSAAWPASPQRPREQLLWRKIPS